MKDLERNEGPKNRRYVQGFLVDPWKQKIQLIKFKHSMDEIYKLLKCSTFDIVTIKKKGDGIFVDDEGLYAPIRCPFIVNTDWGKAPLVNNGLILGVDEDGESVDPKESYDEIKKRILFGSEAFQGYMSEDKTNAH